VNGLNRRCLSLCGNENPLEFDPLCRTAARGLHYGQERKLHKQAGYICADPNHSPQRFNLQSDGGPYNSHSLDDWMYDFSCPVNSNHRHRKGLVTDVSGPQRNACTGTLTPLSRFCCCFCSSNDQGRRCGQDTRSLRNSVLGTEWAANVFASVARQILDRSFVVVFYQA